MRLPVSFAKFLRIQTFLSTNERLLLNTPYIIRILNDFFLFPQKLFIENFNFFTAMDVRFQGLISEAATGGVL